MTEQVIKPKVVFVEMDDIPPAMIGPRNSMYDEAINAIQSSSKDTISIKIEEKSAKQVYAALHVRTIQFNEDPDRQYDLLLAQRKTESYIKRLPKGTLKK